MYTLIIEDRHGRSAAEISFDQGSYTIGRVDGNDVVLPSASVSRTHARIFVDNNKCYIDDLGSANGVQVDGVQLKDRMEIKNGAQIRIGEYTLYLEYKNQNEASTGQEVLKTQIVSGEQSGYKIVRIRDKFAGEEFMLSESSNTIGRTEDNYILLSDNSISRNHAKITNVGLTYKVIDLDSSNGTFVNHKRIKGESVLQMGDEIRFGNVSFLFVPASQVVDVTKYGKRSSNNRVALIAIFSLAIIVFVVIAIVVIFTMKSKGEAKNQETIASEQDELAQFEKHLKYAKEVFEKDNFTEAQEIVQNLLRKKPDDAELIDLNKKVNFEIDNKKSLEKAKALSDNRQYADAIDAYSQIDEKSKYYDKAQDQIKIMNLKVLVMQYNDARSKCDEDISATCINELCDATKILMETISESKVDDSIYETATSKVDDAVAYIENLTSKKKYANAAKNCMKEIKK